MNPDTQIPKNGEEVKRIPLVDPNTTMHYKKLKCDIVSIKHNISFSFVTQNRKIDYFKSRKIPVLA